MTAVLEIQNIRKEYKKSGKVLAALEDLSLEVQAGEFVAVQGPSGSGKSTLLLAAGGLLHPDAGSVHVLGQDFYAMSPEGRARFRAENIGFVFQQFHLVPYLSVMDNILTPALTGVVRDARSKAEKLIEQFGLEERSQHLATELSTGERQRTALARALLADPKLVLADEPTGNLDSGNADTVLEALKVYTRKEGGAVLWVTHNDASASRGDRVVHLKKGLLAGV
ncbi:MAG: ABC transporter ATP-binding protein [Candidatus Sumerlaeia bacterium]